MTEDTTLCPLAIIGCDVRPKGVLASCDPDRCMLAVKIFSNGNDAYVCGLLGFDVIKVITDKDSGIEINTCIREA